MEDMLLREIEKTGKVLEAILLKLGVTTREKGEEAYDFGDDNLERFARILFLLAAGAPDDDTRRRTASAAAALYQYLEGRSSCCFYDRYYILKELEKYL